MLTDKQSLILCGIMAVGIFVSGIFDVLDHFIVLSVLVLIFLAIVINLIFWKHPEEEIEEEENGVGDGEQTE